VDGDLSVGGVINQTGASWSLGGFGPNGTSVNLPYSSGYINIILSQKHLYNAGIIFTHCTKINEVFTAFLNCNSIIIKTTIYYWGLTYGKGYF